MENVKWTEQTSRHMTLEDCFEKAKRLVETETNIKKLNQTALCDLLGFVATRWAVADRKEKFSDQVIYEAYPAKLISSLGLLDSKDIPRSRNESRRQEENGEDIDPWTQDWKKIEAAVAKIEKLIPEWANEKKASLTPT